MQRHGLELSCWWSSKVQQSSCELTLSSLKGYIYPHLSAFPTAIISSYAFDLDTRVMALSTRALVLFQIVFSLFVFTLASSNVPPSAVACQQLKKRYPKQTFVPSSADYVAVVAG